ncbi:MAG: SAM-dependent methyltransferase [Cyclobacteriaceae bacterium]|nr:SAM-dependent methyltransferase [Cyclobacteriaceae bacterium]
MAPGKIYLIPSPISGNNPQDFIPPVILSIIQQLDLFLVENVRTTRRLFSILGVKDIKKIRFETLDKDTPVEEVKRFITLIEEGLSAGIVSEAGCPGIADPGSGFVQAAHCKNISVIPLPGPSSIFLALMASGFNGQQFFFHGYLPIDRHERKKKIREMEFQSKQLDQTQIFMETPYRNRQLIQSLLENLQDSTKLCLASDITGRDEYIKTRTVKEWKKQIPDLHKKPTIYSLSFY